MDQDLGNQVVKQISKIPRLIQEKSIFVLLFDLIMRSGILHKIVQLVLFFIGLLNMLC